MVSIIFQIAVKKGGSPLELVNSAQLIHIIRLTLGHVDARLIGHGEHVAAVVYCMLKDHPAFSDTIRNRLCALGMLHDIGAYKTEEIDDLMGFETAGVWQHSAYGYEFLKLLSPLQEDAQPVLYHHLPYSSYRLMHPPLQDDHFSGLLNIADRADIITRQHGALFCRDMLRNERGNQYSPYWWDLFFEAEARYGLLGRLQDDRFDDIYAEIQKSIHFSEPEIQKYLEMIAYSIDFRSEMMVLHTVTTVNISRVIGEKLALSPIQLEQIYYGSLLHDLGKISTPIEILEKPGKLTADEMAIMKQHVNVTRDILMGSLETTVLNIAVRHHEKLNGSGYPDGLQAQDLSLQERVVSVADIMSALIRRRSYKEAFSKETTMNILHDMMANGQLCPTVTQLVLDHFDEIVSEAEYYSGQITCAYNSIRKNYVFLLTTLPLS